MKNLKQKLVASIAIAWLMLSITSCSREDDAPAKPSNAPIATSNKTVSYDTVVQTVKLETPEGISSLPVSEMKMEASNKYRLASTQLMFKLQGIVVNIGTAKVYKIATSQLALYATPYLLRTYANSGDVRLELMYDSGGGLLKLWPTANHRSISNTTKEVVFMKWATPANVYIVIKGVATSNVDLALYQLPEAFAATGILDKTMSQSGNIFTSDPGECVWGVYNRLLELRSRGEITQASMNVFKNGLTGKTNRHAKNWPTMVNPSGWIYTSASQPLAKAKRKKGLVIAWVFGTHGHIGTVDEVSEDLLSFKVVEYNYSPAGKQLLSSRWVKFDSGNTMSGAYPVFYDLEVSN